MQISEDPPEYSRDLHLVHFVEAVDDTKICVKMVAKEYDRIGRTDLLGYDTKELVAGDPDTTGNEITGGADQLTFKFRITRSALPSETIQSW